MTRTGFQRVQRGLLSLAVAGLGAFGLSGCFYGPPPNYQPMPAQPRRAPTPVESEKTFAPGEGATTLDSVRDAPANEILTVPPPRDPASFYEVRQGDTLTGIARQHGVTLPDLLKANSFDQDQVIQQGQLVKIPVR